ncbi:MAG: zinc ribbon domain-containing protein [Deltaproteobacteria bacterium]|nr:zinc ribbon domain-containing protein [Deltaproteobacteria bacterium]MBI3389634.1 zinc ribbon domain-containing protein [Deltaproteobacteria bacterium]
MQCRQCRAENDDGLRFCESCGTKLAHVCASCGHELKPEARFCGGCGAAATASGAGATHASPSAARSGAGDDGRARQVPSPLATNNLTTNNLSRSPRHRLAAVDWLLLGTLLPVCMFGVVMTVVHGVRGDFVIAPFYASSAPDAQSYPVVRRVLSSPSAEASPLAVGDRLLRLDGSDLRGVSFAGLILRWSQAAQASARSLLLTIERDSTRSDVRVLLVPGYSTSLSRWWTPLPFTVGIAGTALLLLLRATHRHLARRWYVSSLLLAFCFTPYFLAPVAPRAGITLFVLVIPLACGLTLWNLNEFLPGLRLWGRGQRAVAWALALLLSASTAAALWLPDGGPAAIFKGKGGLIQTAFIIAFLVAITRVYQRADPLGRRQIKWVIYGFYVGLLPLSLAFALVPLGVALEGVSVLFAVATIALVACPLGILLAIAFYQFLDIDRLFSATLSYSVLAILGLALVLGVMPTASQAASDALGLAPAYGQMLFAFALAAIVVPAHRVVRPRIDRLLFPQRVALEQGFEHLLMAISGCADMQELTRVVGERLDALLEPAAAVVYARAGDVFTPLAVRGRTAPPAFAAQSTLITTLQERTTPLAAERWTARRSTSLTPFERAAIETLEVAVLVPFRRGADLIAFVCLGPKRSGDIYTPTDLAWLGAAAGKVSDRLLALDATAVAEQARAMQAALRRYVPGAVAARLASGQDIEAGEREVTVLFVDIRGYTGFSEARQAEEIFHTVNRYTEMVSQVVRARGGSVVEFHGDGLLAVFGAPDEMAMKERAAVQVGCEIIAGIAAMAALGASSQPPLSVGVGIGTGPAFVGNIQSSDRFIWTVIGDTVNLAARLQSMTRELNAAVAIDDTTYRRAGREVCVKFVRHAELAIRGRAQIETVYALPL